ncbi:MULTISPECIES: MarR family winged helix-turn-helix transcriptional regulator [unclassified Streptomyces]|uniref:MarR family winged helix-turn-helix transcriptional regulator n=1 Tax=unclassified Streptomyces TaxID=2593676 RepID=UPI002251C895|nr:MULTISPECIES: MarR family winged helix-turn-helix transcriptional regulator [unclassified Streptomyces]MCX4529974.1 MarR family winged helix-turn-helix transcriptional regulator [Streptomyces sp. NBC_01551]MCX4539256.1 MarR family winged helix-turn-helix transcriptional regulator [Streptomyces sp. NBC_01565]
MTSDLQRIQSLPTWLVGRVAARGRGMVADAIAAEGLRLMHHAVLAATAEYGPVTQADLGRRLAVDPKDMVGVLNHLQDKGLVLRAPHPSDRRKNAVTVTPEGTAVLTRCAALAEAANAELLAPLAPDEKKQLVALLTRLHEAAENPA